MTTIENKIGIELFTPELAKEALESMVPQQRKYRDSHALRMAQDIKAGKWRLSPDALTFVSGLLANGQHRLNAVMHAGIPVEFLVLRTNDPALYRVIDSGLSRKASDVIGVPHATVVAAAISLILSYDDQTITPGHIATYTITRTRIMEYMDNHPEIVDQATFMRNLAAKHIKVVSTAIALAIFHLAERTLPINRAREFMINLHDGAANNNAAFDLRERLLRNNTSKKKLQRAYIFCLIAKAYVLYERGLRPGVLRVSQDDPIMRLESLLATH